MSIRILIFEVDDKEFCSLPLTYDISANPFRVGKDTSSGSKLLLNAILAVSSYHLSRMEPSWQDDAHEYKESTLSLLHEKCAEESDVQQRSSLLDAVLALFTLEVTAPKLSLCAAKKINICCSLLSLPLASGQID